MAIEIHSIVRSKRADAHIMIDRYTIKLAPAVSQKEWEKRLHDSGEMPKENAPDMRKMKAKIEVICDFDDLKELTEMLKAMQKEAR